MSKDTDPSKILNAESPSPIEDKDSTRECKLPLTRVPVPPQTPADHVAAVNAL